VLNGNYDITICRVVCGRNFHITIGTDGIFGIILGRVQYSAILMLTLACGIWVRLKFWFNISELVWDAN